MARRRRTSSPSGSEKSIGIGDVGRLDELVRREVGVPREEVAQIGRRGVVAAFGLHGERDVLVGNVSYGQDGEGDDFEGELRAAALRRFRQHLNLGVDGHLRKSLWSTDACDNPSLEYRIGPVLAYGVGPVVLSVAAGLGGVRMTRLESGVVALGGAGF